MTTVQSIERTTSTQPRGSLSRFIAGLVLATVTAPASSPAVAAGVRSERAGTIDQMPPELETRFALSALPPALRKPASVYLLNPAKGYRLTQAGTSGIVCLVQRTAWELGDYRDDIYIPLCYDRAGATTYLRVIMDAAALRAQGVPAQALKARIAKAWADKIYTSPTKAGLSYMLAPIMRTVGPPDMQVRTMAMPHLMFYAPNLTNADIGAIPDLASPASLLNPFVDRQGNDQQSYIIQLVGEADKARILTEEQRLVADLCTYRTSLCLHAMRH